MKKILITGGAGFIGLHLANRLIRDGYSVHLIDNFSRAVEDKELDEVLNNPAVEFSNIDILDEKELLKVNKDYDVIFHLAAIIGVSHVMDRPYDVMLDNIRMLANMIELAKSQKDLSRFMFASTSEVYAGTLSHFGMEIPTPERTALAISDLSHPRTSYMLSKIYGEAMCHQAGIPFTLFRPHNIYGPRMGLSHVIPEQLQKAHKSSDGDEIMVFSPEHTRCFCYVDDAVESLKRMMELDCCEDQTLNLGVQEPEINMLDLAKICYSVVSKDLNIMTKPASPGSPVRRQPNMELMNKLTGFKPQIDLSEGIERTYAWYKHNIFNGNTVSAK